MNNEDIVYIFQGITTDGRYYISMRYGVQHAELLISNRDLPAEYPDMDGFIRDYQDYLNQMEDELNSKPVMSFSPDLIGFTGSIFGCFTELVDFYGV